MPKKFVFYSEISKIITALSPYLQAKSVADDFLKFIYRFFFFFLLFRDNKSLCFMEIVCLAGNSHNEVSRLIFL